MCVYFSHFITSFSSPLPSVPPTTSMDPYDRLVWDCWMPKFRSTISSWSPRICNPVIDLLECWMPLLPSWVMDNILDQMILPRLHKEVETWDPTTDTMPIHAWVHPWLPLMGAKYCILSNLHVLLSFPSAFSPFLLSFSSPSPSLPPPLLLSLSFPSSPPSPSPHSPPSLRCTMLTRTTSLLQNK